VGAVVWTLVAAVRSARRAPIDGEAMLVRIIASFVLFSFVAFLTPLFVFGRIREWYDFQREVPPSGVLDVVFARARHTSLATGFIIVVLAGWVLPPRAKREKDLSNH